MTERGSASAEPGGELFAKLAAPGFPRDVGPPTPIASRQICGLAGRQN